MTGPVSLRIAMRELRAGFGDFRVFLACLILGVAAIAAVGSVRSGITEGLSRQGAALLGGDAEMSFTYRFASAPERAWMADTASVVAEVVDFRSMAVVQSGGESQRALTQVKAVDDGYPLYGKVALQPPQSMAAAFAPVSGVPGAVMQPVLADRLGILPGDLFSLGEREFRLTALLLDAPDAVFQGFSLGPRTIVQTSDLAGSGLIGPGSLFETRYRLKLPANADLTALKARANVAFRDSGLDWHDRRSGAPGTESFVGRMGSFLVLVGLAGLAVGGIGIAAAVRAYLEAKTAVIATLKTLGAGPALVFRIYFFQIGLLAVIGIVTGVALGAALPFVALPLLANELALPAIQAIYPAPLIEAALYGVLTAALFTLWPVARTRDIRPAALFRDAALRRRFWPPWRFGLATVGLIALLLALALWYAEVRWLALWTFGGIALALLVLTLAAVFVRRICARLALSNLFRGRPAWRLAFGAVGGPASEAASVILSLGLGLSVLATIGQIDANLRRAIAGELPDVAPAYFFLDIQREQLGAFLDLTKANPAVSKVETAPMLRGIITRINDLPARDVAGDHWVITGDRGITYAAAMPKGTILTAGKWWPVDYAGPPLVSIADEEAREIGLKIGDTLTINILGRDITARIASFRVVDFSTAGIGFVLLMNPSAVQAAPHTNIATVYADADAEVAILNSVGASFPNVTAIGVREAISRVADALRGLATATSLGAMATLITGVVVLIGAAAAGERARRYEAAVLKALGAGRRLVIGSFAIRAALTGAAAGAVAIAAGAGAAWAVMHFVMEASYRFEPVSALAIVGGGAMTTLLTGLVFARRTLAIPPARVLRARE